MKYKKFWLTIDYTKENTVLYSTICFMCHDKLMVTIQSDFSHLPEARVRGNLHFNRAAN